MRSTHLLLFLLITTSFHACKTSNDSFTIVGDIANMPEQKVFLEELSINEIIVIDSAATDEKGNFELEGKSIEPGLYRVRFEQNQFVLLSIDKGTVKINGDWNNLSAYNVSGSESSTSLRGFISNVREHLKDFNTMSIVIDTLQAQGKDSMVIVAKKDLEDRNFQFTRYIEQYADTTKSLPNALFAVRMLNPATEMDYLKVFGQSIGGRFPESKMAMDFIAKVNVMADEGNKPAAQSVSIGKKAPEIELPTPDGKKIKLSSLKGKYVLIDFWASWCGPCRAENPNVVEAYNKFKNKNFTILGVSLDNDKAKWVQAISDDQLNWAHISDLQGWQSIAARAYNVESIPANFLISPDGEILASDLRGEGLENMLGKVLK